jgi:hypothetical protein
MVDFRDRHYRGFVHTDDAIKQLANVIGHTTHNAARAQILQSVRGDDSHTNHEDAARHALLAQVTQSDHADNNDSVASHPIVLSRIWNTNEIVAKGIQDGGHFKSALTFDWNPFEKHISSALMILRVICSNGAVGLGSLLNTKVPLLNRWEEHLDIASTQIQNKVGRMLESRVHAMTSERATVKQVQLLNKHAAMRALASEDVQQRARLVNLQYATQADLHLADVYKPAVFEDAHISDQLPSHLSAFDAWNVATEMSTHTQATNDSTYAALNRVASQLMFNDTKVVSANSLRHAHRPQSFADAERAFYG